MFEELELDLLRIKSPKIEKNISLNKEILYK
jgi:hypothetical protein